MDIKKKQIPFDLLTEIEKLYFANTDVLKFIKDEKCYYSFTDKDDTNGWFFKIYHPNTKRIGNWDGKSFVYEWKPENEKKTGTYLYQGKLEDVVNQFNVWIKLIHQYNSVHSIYDDNFERKYAEYYFTEFEIVDEDANYSPFDPRQQDIVENYLDSLYSTIDGADIAGKEDMMLEIQSVKNEMPLLTKNQVVKRISKVFGKIFKLSKPLGKKILDETMKSFAKKLFDLGVHYGQQMIDMISNL